MNPVAAIGTLRDEAYWYKLQGATTGLPTWDIFHPYPDNWINNGVKWSSSLHVFMTKPLMDASGKPVVAHVLLWIPGGDQGVAPHDVSWGVEAWEPVAGWDPVVASMVCIEGIKDLAFVWEFVPGSAQA